jgi:predicted ester cyclase
MSLEENKNMVCRIFEEIFNQGKLELASELLADNFVNHTLPGKSGGESVTFTLTLLRQAFDQPHFALEQVLAEGDWVAVRLTFSGIQIGPLYGLALPQSGKLCKQLQMHLFRCVNGKVAEHWAMRDDLSLLNQLGLLPAGMLAPTYQ